MEVLVSSPARDFDFDFNGGGATSPYLSLPSSPKRFGDYYLSAPASPSRFSEFVSEFEYFSATPKHDDEDGGGGNADYSFAFDVSGESEKSSLSAEDLFDGGKIKPLKPPSSRLGADEFASFKSPLVSPRQSRSPMKAISDAFSPKKKETQERRGRDRTPASTSSSNSGRRATRSLSPYRNSDYAWEEERYLPQQQQPSSQEASSSNSRSLLTSSSGNSKSSRKWRLRDLLLFRSASEGRGSNKDPLRKYSVAYKRPEEAKTSSFRSVDSPTAAHGSKRRGAKSAHELHYAMKKAETQDLKKRTFLPYKQGILGALAGFGSLTR